MKKDFSALLDATKVTKQTPEEAPAIQSTPAAHSTTQTTDEIRVTLTMSADLKAKVDALAFARTGKTGRRVLIKDIIAEALQNYIDGQN